MEDTNSAESMPLESGQTATLSPALALTRGVGRERAATVLPVSTLSTASEVIFTAVQGRHTEGKGGGEQGEGGDCPAGLHIEHRADRGEGGCGQGEGGDCPAGLHIEHRADRGEEGGEGREGGKVEGKSGGRARERW